MSTNSLTRILLSGFVAAVSSSTAMAQSIASGAVTIDSVQTHIVDSRVDVAFKLNLDNLKLKAEQQLVLTPMLVADGDTLALSPLSSTAGRSRFEWSATVSWLRAAPTDANL